MFHYFWPHCCFHLIRMFPMDNRRKARGLVWFLSLITIIPQIVVIFLPRSGRCPEPLVELLLGSIILTFFSLGFTVLFTVLEPVPFKIKIIFHAFGGVDLIYTLVHSSYAIIAYDCKENSAEIYWMSFVLMLLYFLSIGWILATMPFWIYNARHFNTIFDQEAREGLCYPAYRACSCVWHI